LCNFCAGRGVGTSLLPVLKQFIDIAKKMEISDKRNLKADKICNAGECGYILERHTHKHFDLKQAWT
jgi:hypothetical protein